MKQSPIDVAAVYDALDDKHEAFRILEDAIEDGNQQLIALKEDPTVESLHSDARWKVLLRRMNFPWNDPSHEWKEVAMAKAFL